MNKIHGSRLALLLPVLPALCGLLLLTLDPLPLQALRNNLFDQYQRWSPREYQAAPVRIIDIDDDSLSHLGQWPWPRTRMAEMVDRLSEAGAAAIVFDVMFAEADRTSPQIVSAHWPLNERQAREIAALPDHDTIFAKHIEQAGVVLGFATTQNDFPVNAASTAAADASPKAARFVYAGDQPGHWLHAFDNPIRALPVLEQAAQGNGAVSFVPDSDGVVRRVPLVLQIAGQVRPTLASEALRVAQETHNIILKSAGHGAGLTQIRIGEQIIPTTAHGEIWVHYSRPVRERYIPAWELFDERIPANKLAGHIVLIGSSAQGLMDLRFSPLGHIIPGVEAHAQALEQVLTGHFLQRPGWARAIEAIVLLACCLLVGLLALRMRVLYAAAASLLLLTALLGAGWHAFADYQLLLDSATPAIGLILSFFLCSLFQHFTSEREQRWIKTAFTRYVSPNRVSHLIEHPDAMALGGRRQECSFIFTDLAGFTHLMESIDPADAVTLLNDYLDAMIAIAFRYEGTLDRIVGDAVAIMFSAPVFQADHQARALACALEMQAFASHYASEQQARGIAFGQTRIGVHSGEVIVGNFGGKTMFDYRALGDAVNTASRLESVNKHLGTRICLSATTLAGCPNARTRPIGRIILLGKSEALSVHEPLGADLAPCQAPEEAYRTAFEAMQQERPEATALFNQLATDFPDDPLVRLHLNRLNHGESGDLIVMSQK